MAVAIARANTPDTNTPNMEPAISLAQKQALIHNLQLESEFINEKRVPKLSQAVTERARKLRAQYALHAQGLRSRLEMRINRIPQSLRSTNILELVEKCAVQSEAPNSKASPPRAPVRTAAPKAARPGQNAQHIASNPQPARSKKRSSNEMLAASDKENAGVHDELSLPKKRTKTGPSTQATGRGVSRKVNPSQVLSPKSHNSRTLPRSPIKGQPSSSSGLSSPPKSFIARPTSPLKPGPSVSAATAALAGVVDTKGSRPNTASSTSSSGTAGSLRGKRVVEKGRADMPPPPIPAKGTRNRAASSSSNSSNTSGGTTVASKKVSSRAAPARKGLVGKTAGSAASAMQKTTASSVKKVAAAATGGRTLRTRK